MWEPEESGRGSNTGLTTGKKSDSHVSSELMEREQSDWGGKQRPGHSSGDSRRMREEQPKRWKQQLPDSRGRINMGLERNG